MLAASWIKVTFEDEQTSNFPLKLTALLKLQTLLAEGGIYFIKVTI